MLRVESLSTFYGKVQALRSVSIQVEKGHFVSIVGSNGSGKSTLLGSIYGLLPYSEGAVWYDGIDVSHWATDKLVRMGIALVPENRELFSELSIQDNLLLGAYPNLYNKNKGKIKASFESVCNLFPILGKRMRHKAGTLSGGQQQMLAIGRALMSIPQTLILDEPSLGLAPIVVKEIFETIGSLHKGGVTILLVEQNALLALQLASYAYVMKTGTVAMQGPSAELLKNQNIRKMYLGEAL
jgi:branched-chain amino acid transport system ATP-binding protein